MSMKRAEVRSEVEARAFQSSFRLTMTFEQPPSRSAVFFGSLYEYDVTNVYAIGYAVCDALY